MDIKWLYLVRRGGFSKGYLKITWSGQYRKSDIERYNRNIQTEYHYEL